MAAGWVPALAAESSDQAGPIGLVLILVLVVALVFLARSMIRHLKRVPPSFDRTDDSGAGARERARDHDGAQDRDGARGPDRDGDGDGRV